MTSTEHRGQKYEAIVRQSRMPLSELARRLKVHRTTLYKFFDKYDLSWDIIIETGKIIEYDFSKEFKYLRSEFQKEVFNKVDDIQGKYARDEVLEKCTRERDMWMNRYLELSTKYTELLEKINERGGLK